MTFSQVHTSWPVPEILLKFTIKNMYFACHHSTIQNMGHTGHYVDMESVSLIGAQRVRAFQISKSEMLSHSAGLYNLSIASRKLPVVKLVDNFDASYGYVANEGSVFSFMTNLNAPRYR
jgi:hypothetical protein